MRVFHIAKKKKKENTKRTVLQRTVLQRAAILRHAHYEAPRGALSQTKSGEEPPPYAQCTVHTEAGH